MLKRSYKLFILVALFLSFQPRVDALSTRQILQASLAGLVGAPVLWGICYGLKKFFSSSESGSNPELAGPKEDGEDNQLGQGSVVDDNEGLEFGDDTRTEGEKIPLNEVADPDVQNLPDLTKYDFVKQVEPSDSEKQNVSVEQNDSEKLGLGQYSEALQARLKALNFKP